MKSNQVIINWVNKDTSILDLGCGDGSILEILSLEKNVKGLGVEIDPKNISGVKPIKEITPAAVPVTLLFTFVSCTTAK